MSHSVGVGAYGQVVLPRSRHSATFLEDKDQRNPEVRVYVAFDLGRF